MPDTREKLIELTAKHQQEADKLSDAAKTAFGDDRTVSVFKWVHSLAAAHKEFVAELDEVSTLLENGVTIQKWIPVTERLPDLIPCDAGAAYSEAVNVLTSGRKVLTAIWDGTDFIADAEFWEAEGEEITHWTPVLLPLPAPPKGE